MGIRFWLNDRLIEESNVRGTTTLLRYLRDHRGLTGSKEGCAEGDCGACTVAVIEERPGEAPTFRAVNSCLMFLPMLQGKRVYTVEALRERERAMHDSASGFHPTQMAMVDRRGSQCGYCTPGIVMSLFEACYRDDMGEDWQVDDQLCGNLCRCTGYRPIREAGNDVAGLRPDDRFMAELRNFRAGNAALDHEAQGQRYLQPTSLDELFALRAQHPDAVLVAGGTDLGLAVTKAHARWPVVIGLEGLDALRTLERTDAAWQIGAGVTLTRAMEVVGPELPLFHKMMQVFGSRQIRSRATLGGNICNASPIGDTPPILLALDAVAVVVGPDGARDIPFSEFFLGYRQTALRPEEVLLRVDIPHLSDGARAQSYKVSKRRELDISICAAAMYVETDGDTVSAIRLAYGGMAATPKRATQTEAALLGQTWSRDVVEQALDRLDQDFQPIDDHRASARYRSLVAKNLLRGFFLETAP